MARTRPDPLGGARAAPLLDHISDGVVVVDHDRRICLVNPVAAKLTGVDPAQAIGLACHRFFTGADSGERCALTSENACTVCTVFETGRSAEAHAAQIALPGGWEKTLNVRAVPLRGRDGEVARVAVLLDDVSELHRLRNQLGERHRFHNLIGKNHRMHEIYRLIEQIAETDATVLIEGESGTGKELVARAIHHRSRRAERPFVQVNCGALVETLLESELFGHVRGAFTGAVRDKVGRFEAANGGTIFLDEIGDVSPAVQVKLLRVIQERQFERVGESAPRTTDVRIIAATNRRLTELMERGAFREDLYYRLRVVPIHLPPLRERREDIPLLVEAFVERFRSAMGKRISSVSGGALARLMDYHWPGNVRELENAIEHGFVRCTGGEIRVEHLPVEVRSGAEAPLVAAPSVPGEAPRTLRPAEPAERAIILAALEAAGGSRTEAAGRLGVSRTTLWRRMKGLGIVS